MLVIGGFFLGEKRGRAVEGARKRAIPREDQVLYH